MSSTTSKGDCVHCERPVYGNSNPTSCNAGFRQDPMGPEGQGVHYHMSCQLPRERAAREAKRAAHKEGLWADYKLAVMGGVGFLLGWLARTVTL